MEFPNHRGAAAANNGTLCGGELESVSFQSMPCQALIDARDELLGDECGKGFVLRFRRFGFGFGFGFGLNFSLSRNLRLGRNLGLRLRCFAF